MNGSNFWKWGIASLWDTIKERGIKFNNHGNQFHWRYVLSIKRLLAGVYLDLVRVNKTKTPILFLWGHGDLVCPLAKNRPVVDRLTNARLEIFSGGHVWYHKNVDKIVWLISSFHHLK